MSLHRIIAATALAAAVPGVAAAAVSRDAYTARTITVAKHQIGGAAQGKTATASARVTFPARWQRAGRGTTQLTLRAQTTRCLYTVRVTTGVDASTDQDAATHAATLTPSAGRGYLIDDGTRGQSVWRVTRVPDRRIVRLRAVRVTPLSSVAQQAGLAADQKAYQVTTATAESRPTDECHAGTYREVVGPAIGDALATARTRAYADLTRP